MQNIIRWSPRCISSSTKSYTELDGAVLRRSPEDLNPRVFGSTSGTRRPRAARFFGRVQAVGRYPSAPNAAVDRPSSHDVRRPRRRSNDRLSRPTVGVSDRRRWRRRCRRRRRFDTRPTDVDRRWWSDGRRWGRWKVDGWGHVGLSGEQICGFCRKNNKQNNNKI